MITSLTACILGCTTAVSLLGWWSATRAYNRMADLYDAALDEARPWEEVVRFAGRCAWHAANESATRPPQHLVASHMVEHYAAGFDLERAAEDLATAGWNGAMGRAAE